MQYDIFLSAFTLSLIASITPGPNNSIISTISASHGFWRAMPYSLGVIFGFPLMVYVFSLGVGQLLFADAVYINILRGCGVIFLFYIAWQIWQAGNRRFDAIAQTTDQGKKVPGFFYGMFFQWINVKALGFALSLISNFLPATDELGNWSKIIISLILFACCVISTLTWALLGRAFARFLTNQRRYKIFSRLMAILLFVSSVDIALA